jgi:hypothetical protein
MGTIESRGTHAGLDWLCMVSDQGHRCGYVEIPEGHALHGLSYDAQAPGVAWDDLREEPMGKRGIMAIFADTDAPPRLDVVFDVHGSLTFGGELRLAPGWWLGFDCAHDGDAPDPDHMSEERREFEARYATGGQVRSQAYVEAECRSLCEQITARYPLEARTDA